ncbi:MAG TPA: GNAT family N-acetyltransferase [Edaphocola sp.]|nr:GNAT family N-acetyltransferase [Edaphocola sp.]
MKETYLITRAQPEHPDFLYLISALDADLAQKNGANNDFFAQFNKLGGINHVILAYNQDEPVGCGAIKCYDQNTMEIKRMFVAPQYRNNGIAGAILQALLEWATELGFQRCILETGEKMTAAIALYQKHGFSIIPNYEPYTAVKDSMCFEKSLKRKVS